VSSNSESHDPQELEREIKESIEKVRDLTNEMKIVQEHESALLEDDEPPLLQY
jgi:hypothetical protein